MIELRALVEGREGLVLMLTRVGVMAPGLVSALGIKLKWFVRGSTG